MTNNKQQLELLTIEAHALKQTVNQMIDAFIARLQQLQPTEPEERFNRYKKDPREYTRDW